MRDNIFDKKLSYFYNQLSALGNFYPLDIMIEPSVMDCEMVGLRKEWHHYNQSKPFNLRQGISLTSLGHEPSAEIDLNSLREYNIINGTSFNEMSFRVPTKYWDHISAISTSCKDLLPWLGRSHLIKFGEGGFFPPHRDLGVAFRLISFYNCSPDYLCLKLGDQLMKYECNTLYFLDTRKTHSLFSMMPEAVILVLNIELCTESVDFVINHLRDK